MMTTEAAAAAAERVRNTITVTRLTVVLILSSVSACVAGLLVALGVTIMSLGDTRGNLNEAEARAVRFERSIDCRSDLQVSADLALMAQSKATGTLLLALSNGADTGPAYRELADSVDALRAAAEERALTEAQCSTGGEQTAGG